MSKLILSLGFFICLSSLTTFSQEPGSNGTAPSYFFSSTVEGNFETICDTVKALLKKEGFGVITEINLDEKLNEKLGVSMKKYRLLGVCNPKIAYEAIGVEENIGLFLPCKILLKQLDGNKVEVVCIDPENSMKMLGNPELDEISKKVTIKLKTALGQL